MAAGTLDDDAVELRIISQSLQLMVVVRSGLGVRVRLSLVWLGALRCSGMGRCTSRSSSERLPPLTQA